jgi:hypothetical protein
MAMTIIAASEGHEFVARSGAFPLSVAPGLPWRDPLDDAERQAKRAAFRTKPAGRRAT